MARRGVGLTVPSVDTLGEVRDLLIGETLEGEREQREFGGDRVETGARLGQRQLVDDAPVRAYQRDNRVIGSVAVQWPASAPLGPAVDAEAGSVGALGTVAGAGLAGGGYSPGFGSVGMVGVVSTDG